MSENRKPGPMTALALALLAPDAIDRQLLNNFARWHDAFQLPAPPRMQGVRQKGGGVWVQWLEQKPAGLNDPFLIVDVASRQVVARSVHNHPKLVEGAVFEVGHRYRLIPLATA